MLKPFILNLLLCVSITPAYAATLDPADCAKLVDLLPYPKMRWQYFPNVKNAEAKNYTFARKGTKLYVIDKITDRTVKVINLQGKNLKGFEANVASAIILEDSPSSYYNNSGQIRIVNFSPEQNRLLIAFNGARGAVLQDYDLETGQLAKTIPVNGHFRTIMRSIAGPTIFFSEYEWQYAASNGRVTVMNVFERVGKEINFHQAQIQIPTALNAEHEPRASLNRGRRGPPTKAPIATVPNLYRYVNIESFAISTAFPNSILLLADGRLTLPYTGSDSDGLVYLYSAKFENETFLWNLLRDDNGALSGIEQVQDAPK